MADTNLTDQERRIRIAELYKALTEKNEYVARVLGRDPPEHPVQEISDIYNNTFLHMAIRFKEKDLVNKLLEELAKEDNRTVLSNKKNNEGNTILHEVATSDTMQDVAEKMLKIDPQLLIARNKLGETPIFCAARYGQFEMFWFLAVQLKQTVSPEVAESCLQRTDGTTVLHISIFSECFGELFCLNSTASQNPFLFLIFFSRCSPISAMGFSFLSTCTTCWKSVRV